MDIPFLFFQILWYRTNFSACIPVGNSKTFLNEKHVHLGLLCLFAWFPACIKVGRCTVV